MIRALATVTLLAATSVEAQVYRCEDAAGQTEFSQTPCAADAEALDLASPTEPTHSAEDGDSSGLRPGELKMLEERETRREERSRSRRRQSAMYRGEIVHGMTERQVLRAWGEPTDVNRSSSAREQWIYRHEQGAQYIYLESGRVTGWNEN